MAAIGIDLGSSKSVIACCGRGEIKILTNEVSRRSTPSVVAFSRGKKQRFIGESGVTQERTNLKNTIRGMKRLIGRKFSDPVVQQEVEESLYEIVEGPDDSILVNVSDA